MTFLYTDLEGSSRLWEAHQKEMRIAVERHDAILREAIEGNGGQVFRTVGDGLCAAFPTAPQAVVAALSAQRALLAEHWGEVGQLRVRMALHAGAVEARNGDYVGACLNRIGRLLGLAHGGQVLVSQAVCDLAADSLPEHAGLRDLGEHRLRDLVRAEHIHQLCHPELPDGFPALKSLNAYPTNLPLQLTSFVGREREIAEVRRLLGTTRLLTLTGTGGCGKTRLALQVAADLLGDYQDGVWLVELAPISDAALVADVVAAALGLRAGPAQPVQATLLSYLRTRQILVVLDNCEHLLDACAGWTDGVLRACPDVRILATSREALGIAGEVSWRVPSLSLPTGESAGPPGSHPDGEAVRLFVERAGAVQPSFELTEQNAHLVGLICQRLDGIPLAIELAATRVRTLSLDQIAGRLDQRFGLLTGGSRTALPRQQTLAATVGWSYDLLSEPERRFFDRLSVFAGGFSLEAAEVVCGDAEDAVDLLSSLVAKSLVVADSGVEGVERYHLLETLRQYGREKLVAIGEAEEVQQRHAAYYVGLAVELRSQVYDRRQLTALARLDQELGNLRAALRWFLDAGAAGPGLRLLTAVYWTWFLRGLSNETRTWLEAFLALPSAGARSALQARALAILGLVTWWDGDVATSRAHLEQARAMAREVGDPSGEGEASMYLGAQTFGEEGRALLEESLRLRRLAGDDQGITQSLTTLSRREFAHGEPTQARLLVAEALERSRRRGDRRMIAYSLEVRGEAESVEQPDLARADLEEGLRLYQEIGDQAGVITVENLLGRLDALQGSYQAAREHYVASLRLSRDWHWLLPIAQSLDGLVIVAVELGEVEKAVVLAGFATRDGLYRHPDEAEVTELVRALGPIRQALGEERARALQARGQAMTLEEAVEYALRGEG